MTVLYGIGNCSSCKQARGWLDKQGIDYMFHDLRAQGVPEDRLDHWLEQLGWEALLNRRGTTWRKIAVDAGPLDARRARELMLAHPTLIKRPILEIGAGLVLGYSSAQYDVAFEGAD